MFNMSSGKPPVLNFQDFLAQTLHSQTSSLEYLKKFQKNCTSTILSFREKYKRKV